MQLAVIDGNGANQVVCTLAPTPVFTDRSGTIATGGTAQTLAQANSGRSGWAVYNPDSTTPLYLSDTGNAATNSITSGNGSYVIPAGQWLTSTQIGMCSTLALSIFSTVTGKGFIAREW